MRCPAIGGDYGRSAALEDFGREDVLALAALAESAPTSALRARLADIAVCAGTRLKMKPWKSGVLAAKEYFNLAESRLLEKDGIRVLDEFRRGLAVAWMYCRDNSAIYDAYWELVQSAVRTHLTTEHPGIAFILAQDIQRRRSDLAQPMAELFEERGLEFERNAAFDSAARCFDIARRLWHRLGERVATKRCHILLGEVLVKRAISASGKGLAQATWLAEGIDVLRRAGASKPRLYELRQQLEQIQRATLDSFGRHEHSVDVSDVVREVDARITGQTFFEQLLQLAYDITQLPRHEKVREQVIDQANRYPLSSMFASEYVNEDGAVIARSAPFDAADEDSVYCAMIRQCHDFDLSFTAKVVVSRGIDVIFTQNHPGLIEVHEVVTASPMVPDGHELSVARGLLAGINGDWLEAALFLCGKVEPIVRHLFRLHDVVTTLPRDDGTQTEQTLSELLANDEAQRVLGKDVILAVQTLMIHRMGYLLRHNWAHGLVGDSGLVSPGVVALWWLTWRIILWPWQVQRMSKSTESERAQGEQSEGKA